MLKNDSSSGKRVDPYINRMEENNSGLLAEIRKRVEQKKRRNTEISALSEEDQVTASTSREADRGTAEAQSANYRRGPSGTAEREIVNNMAAPCNSSSGAVYDQFNEHLKEFIDQGPVFLKLQQTVSKLGKRMSNLERKRSNTDPVCDSNNTKRARVQPSTSKQGDVDDSESDSSGSEEINKETTSPDIELSVEDRTLDDILSDGEDMEEDNSDDNFLGDLKKFYEDSEETGPNIDSEIAKIVNKGLRSMGQADAVKKLKEKHKRPENVPNLTVPRVAPIIWKTLSKKAQNLDWAVQKTMTKFMCGLTPILKQMNLVLKHKAELKQNPIIKELKQLAADSVLMITHAVAASNQVRKDAIKTELDSKFHSICDSSHSVSEKQLFGDNLNTTLKELDDTKRFHLNKYSFDKKDRKFRKSSDNTFQGFHKGWGKNHRPTYGKKPLNHQSYSRKKGSSKTNQNRQ